MKIQPIDVDKIRGKWEDNSQYKTFGDPFARGDDTEQSLKTIAEKVNEIIMILNKD